MKRSSVLVLSAVISAAGFAINLNAADETAAPPAEKILLTEKFDAPALRWAGSGGIAGVALADGPAAGDKALKLHFKIDTPKLGWPQCQRYLDNGGPALSGPVIAEFDIKVERIKGNIKLSLQAVPFNEFSCSALPFVDDGKWQKVQVRITPKKPGAKLARLAFVVDQRQPNAGDENIFYIANLQLRAAGEVPATAAAK